MKKPFVISVASISGGGKTTVVKALKNRLVNTAVIYFDDYGDDVYLDRDINEWSADGNDYNEWHVDPIAADIQKLMSESYDCIILDYPFGRLNDCVGKYIDFAVFIDTPLDIALARRTIRDYTNRAADRNKISVNLSTIEKELRFYLERSRPTYARMPKTQIPFSDLIVDGTKEPGKIADEIIERIGEILKEETDEELHARIYPIILSEYNSAWPEWYAEEKANLERLIGTKNIVRISHYGSTSVPGLLAKPTIDILLEINGGTDVDKLMAAMPSSEYICLYGSGLTMPTPPPHLMIIKGYLADGFAEKVYHIHVQYAGERPDQLYFRDYLIAHPETAAEYAELKRKLFRDLEHDRDGYTEAKGEFVRRITQKAKEESNND